MCKVSISERSFAALDARNAGTCIVNTGVCSGYMQCLIKTEKRRDSYGEQQNLVVTGGLVAHELGWLSTKPRIHSNHALESQMQTARKYTLSIGTNDKDTYTQLIPTNQARDIINEICTRYVGGYTAWEAMGGWVDETGTLTQEHTLVYSFYDVEEKQITAIMDEVLDKLNQNTILIESGDVESMYYGGSEK